MVIKNEIIEKMELLIASAFGFVAALAWNDAVKSLFAKGGSLEFVSKTGVWIYPIIVTLLAVMVTVSLGKASNKVKARLDKKLEDKNSKKEKQ